MDSSFHHYTHSDVFKISTLTKDLMSPTGRVSRDEVCAQGSGGTDFVLRAFGTASHSGGDVPGATTADVLQYNRVGREDGDGNEGEVVEQASPRERAKGVRGVCEGEMRRLMEVTPVMQAVNNEMQKMIDDLYVKHMD